MGNPNAQHKDDREERKEINLRIPPDMFEEASRRAQKRGISLNAWISNVIARALEEGNVTPFRR